MLIDAKYPLWAKADIRHRRLCPNTGHSPHRPAATVLGMAYAMPQQAEQACSKMTRLNFQINHKARDDLVPDSDSVTTWLKASAIAVLAIGATVVGAMKNYGDVIEYLRAIAIRW